MRFVDASLQNGQIICMKSFAVVKVYSLVCKLLSNDFNVYLYVFLALIHLQNIRDHKVNDYTIKETVDVEVKKLIIRRQMSCGSSIRCSDLRIMKQKQSYIRLSRQVLESKE